MKKVQFSDDIHRRFSEASRLIRRKELDKAERILRGLLEEESSYAMGWWLLGTIFTHKRFTGKAGPDSLEDQIQSFRRAIEFEPDNAMFQECLGMCLIQNKEFHQGIQVLEKAQQLESSIILEHSLPGLEEVVRQTPGNPHFLYGLSCVFNLVGMKDKAEEFRERAFKANIHVGLYNEKRFDEAERITRQILESNPEDSGAWMILGSIQNEKKLWSEAETSFKKALEIELEYPHAWLGLAIALIRQERFDEAQEAKEKAELYEWNVE